MPIILQIGRETDGAVLSSFSAWCVEVFDAVCEAYRHWCAERVGIVCGRHSYHARTCFASYADVLGIMHGHAPHAVPMRSAPMAGRYGTLADGHGPIVPFR